MVHGPNLNALGKRQTDIYGTATLSDIDELLMTEASDLGIEVEVHQTAREGEIVELLHAASPRFDGAIVNPAAYSHTSRAIADAIRSVGYPVIEVHLSNIHAREPWRRESVTAEACRGVVAGLGRFSYVVALRGLRLLLEHDEGSGSDPT